MVVSPVMTVLTNAYPDQRLNRECVALGMTLRRPTVIAGKHRYVPYLKYNYSVFI
jgi:hypothetical protein